MAKRCGGSRNKPCPQPKARWWKDALGVDWFNQGSGGGASDWILATGEWNDSGFWRDDEVWID